VQTAILKNAFYRVGQGALGMSLWNQGGGGPKTFGNHWSKSSTVAIIFCSGIFLSVVENDVASNLSFPT
jgi:hypothetical protein